ncbi:MAG: 3-oxoacyl-ACP reductase [Gammaproteobacteria bacterium]|nr:3-oxoacyl-ACP reductase [Gammaproteobacteria bacterium]HBW83500.1 3-oxoacyl-ACP reductase [Gammaproteobacteria bacterium]|tara:strand:+ start:1320 stop:2141 length:822 start_codon:yes stop_codon:yes gene_type:complete
MNSDYSLSNLFNLEGKTALVTGGSSGLGLNMAKALVQNGVKVAICSRRKEKMDLALSDLRKFGDCIAITADITLPEDRSRVLEGVEQYFGCLSILVNNAGANWGAPLAEYPDEGFEKVISTNLNAVFALTRDAVPLLKKSASVENPSRIVNIGSMDGLHVPVVQRVPTFAYSASKAALHHLTRALAVELGPQCITVNAVAPGFFESRMTDYIFEHYLQDIEADCPLRRVGQAEEIAGVIIYLASRAGNYTNGAVIPLDGGTSVSKGAKPWDER